MIEGPSKYHSYSLSLSLCRAIIKILAMQGHENAGYCGPRFSQQLGSAAAPLELLGASTPLRSFSAGAGTSWVPT